jgi:ubiquinone/menaquinone biosynthesis C-methylase UbiE
MSTRALRIAFPEAETVVGVDTSSEMISMAQFLSQHSSVAMRLAQSFTHQYKTMTCPKATSFTEGNAEKTLFPGRSFDLVTIMYAFHEAPKEGRGRILREAHRLLEPGGTLAVIDICTDYTLSKAMLAGGPLGTTFESSRQNI